MEFFFFNHWCYLKKYPEKLIKSASHQSLLWLCDIVMFYLCSWCWGSSVAHQCKQSEKTILPMPGHSDGETSRANRLSHRVAKHSSRSSQALWKVSGRKGSWWWGLEQGKFRGKGHGQEPVQPALVIPCPSATLLTSEFTCWHFPPQVPRLTAFLPWAFFEATEVWPACRQGFHRHGSNLQLLR